MREQYIGCPKCDDELTFEIEHHTADDGEWYTAGLITEQKHCDCDLSDGEIEALESEALSSFIEGLNYD